jgi:hypothetical protein
MSWWGKLQNEELRNIYCPTAITMNETKEHKTRFMRRGNE